MRKSRNHSEQPRKAASFQWDTMLVTIHPEGRKPFAISLPAGAWALIEEYAHEMGQTVAQTVAADVIALARCAREDHETRNQSRTDAVYRELLAMEERTPISELCAGMEVAK